MKRFFSGLTNIRNRPLRERRVIGVAVYLAAAALAVALWLPSFRNILLPEKNIREPRPAASGTSRIQTEAEAKPKESSFAKLMTPLEALKELIGQGLGALREFNAEFKATAENIKREERDAMMQITEPASEVIPTPFSTDITMNENKKDQEPAEKSQARTVKKTRLPSSPPPPLLAETVNENLDADNGRLLKEVTASAAMPLQSETPAAGAPHQFTAALSRNLSDIRQAVTDFYKYLVK